MENELIYGMRFGDWISVFSLLLSALSFLVSAATLLWAVMSGRRVLDDWRTQRQLDAKAEVAKEAMVAVSMLADFLTERAMDMQPEQHSLELMNGYEQRWGAFKSEAWERTWRARALLEAYIPAALGEVDDLRTYGVQLYGHQSRCTGTWFGKHPDDYGPNKAKAYGGVPRTEIASRRERAIEALIGPAKHEDKKIAKQRHDDNTPRCALDASARFDD